MKLFSHLKDRGISMKVLNICFLVLAVILSVVLFIVVNRTDEIYKETHEITQNLINARDFSDDVVEASDYLTEQVRSFAVTGERVYLDNYFREIDETKRRDKALQMLDKNSENKEAFSELEDAIRESKILEEQEYYAARMAIEGFGYDVSEFPETIQEHHLKEEDLSLSQDEKKRKAIELLFNDRYQERKETIRTHTKGCLDRLLDDMHQTQNMEAEKLQRYVFFGHLISFILLVIILLMVLLTSLLIITPISKAVKLIREEKDIPPGGAYEMRFLAKNYNLMYNTHVQSKKKLNFEANHDKLTGLYNRRGYDFLLKNTDLETSALMIIDLDKFKEINDHYGHAMGDKVLKRVGDAIFTTFRSDDYVCRIGGDEFAVIMIHLGPALINLVRMKYETMSKKLAEPMDGVPSVTISTGVAFGEYRIGASALFKNADRALYNAKESGRNTIRFHKYDQEQNR